MNQQIFFILLFLSLSVNNFAQEKFYKNPDVMPIFPSCETFENELERNDCTNQKIKEFIQKHLKTPQDVNLGKTEGRVKLTYIIEKDGSILNTQIIQSLSESCDKEAKRLVESMPLFIPGKNNQLKVRVIDTIEVNFSVIFRVVENMPILPGCEDIIEKKEKKECAEEKLKEYIMETMEYPEIAWENGTEGLVFTRFIVRKDGSLTDFEIIEEFRGRNNYLGDGLEEEALRIIESMPNWKPGTQRGRPVHVLYALPIKFDIEDYQNYFHQKAKAERRAKKRAKKG